MRHSASAFGLSVALLACGGGGAGNAPARPADASPSIPVETTSSTLTVAAWIEEQESVVEDGTLMGLAVKATAEAATTGAMEHLEQAFWGESEWPTLPARYSTVETSRPDVFKRMPTTATEVEGQFATVERVPVSEVSAHATQWLVETEARLPSDLDGFSGALETSAYQAWFSSARSVLC
ncbi:MAG: hypothetical protein AAF658_22125, partial [Myxococcota bacterium]